MIFTLINKINLMNKQLNSELRNSNFLKFKNKEKKLEEFDLGSTEAITKGNNEILIIYPSLLSIKTRKQ
jgi:hypothetical protein